ncbi:MAG: HD domain-containing protein [Candidatus Hydrogenedentes bacterium]|nr:HD domain-containing protein [Candidatus Hydrogenedentota bacterium]
MDTQNHYSSRVADAFAFAHRIHREQTRKGSGAPYITHIMAVAGIVGEHGASEDTFIAALLHDAAEDGDGEATIEEIRRLFGERVADWVRSCSDTMVKPKPEWRPRKEQFIESIRRAPHEVRLIVAADKLHNVCATISDYHMHGDAVWERFNGGREGTLWYYVAIATALAEGWEHDLIEELAAAVEELHETAAG